MLCLAFFLLVTAWVESKVLFQSSSVSTIGWKGKNSTRSTKTKSHTSQKQDILDQYRIAGGSEATPNQYPWMVKFGWLGCGGSLISNRHVLTAYHCVDEVTSWKGKQLKVGVHNRKDDSDYQLVPIETAVWPLNYNIIGKWSDWEMDIAIIILKTPVDLFDKKISTIDLPSSHDVDYRGEIATAMGWGFTHQGTKLSDKLKHVDLTVSQEETQNYLFTDVELVNGEYQDPCAGDSGGPLVHRDGDSGRWTIIGTVSGGGYDCRYGKVAGKQKWNKVSAHLEWIKSVIKKACSVEDGVFIAAGNNVIDSVASQGPKDCANLCLATYGCVAWTLRVNDWHCWLKSDDSSKGKNEGWMTGTKDCGETVSYRVSSYGEAGEIHSSHMGDYFPTGDNINQCPFFRKGDDFLYVDTMGEWAIGSKAGVATGWIYHPENNPTPSTPPVTGWKFTKGRNTGWFVDGSLTVVPFFSKA